jgi:hypothetical protein
MEFTFSQRRSFPIEVGLELIQISTSFPPQPNPFVDPSVHYLHTNNLPSSVSVVGVEGNVEVFGVVSADFLGECEDEGEALKRFELEEKMKMRELNVDEDKLR